MSQDQEIWPALKFNVQLLMNGTGMGTYSGLTPMTPIGMGVGYILTNPLKPTTHFISCGSCWLKIFKSSCIN